MAEYESRDLDFDISEYTSDPFKGMLAFTVQKTIRITGFEFSTHEMGCRRAVERRIKYGLKLKLNGKILFSYCKESVDVQVSNELTLTPGNTYTLETWLGGHGPSKAGQVEKECQYHYAQVHRCDATNYAPFNFVFGDDDDEHSELSNKTCIYVISYEILE